MKIKKNKFDAYNNPTYLMYECDKGARWTAVKGGGCEDPDNSPCCFSGCESGHNIHIKSETKDRDTACNWFLNPYTTIFSPPDPGKS